MNMKNNQIPMNHYEEMVEANDNAYIPGMLALGTSVEKISL